MVGVLGTQRLGTKVTDEQLRQMHPEDEVEVHGAHTHATARTALAGVLAALELAPFLRSSCVFMLVELMR